jgi:membrane protein DedA with SNARE-associated domain
MSDRAESIFDWLISIPDWLLYLIVGLAAGIENLVPPLPGDLVVLTGAIAAGAGGAKPVLLFLVVWLANLSTSLLVYFVGRRYGAEFFAGPLGSFLLAPRQVDALGAAYRRFGFTIIFFSRFLPVFRPVVPVFAGVSRLGFWTTVIPLAAASAVWYGFLVYMGLMAGENWRDVVDFLDRIGSGLWLLAASLLVVVGLWWWRSRLPEEPS